MAECRQNWLTFKTVQQARIRLWLKHGSLQHQAGQYAANLDLYGAIPLCHQILVIVSDRASVPLFKQLPTGQQCLLSNVVGSHLLSHSWISHQQQLVFLLDATANSLHQLRRLAVVAAVVEHAHKLTDRRQRQLVRMVVKKHQVRRVVHRVFVRQSRGALLNLAFNERSQCRLPLRGQLLNLLRNNGHADCFATLLALLANHCQIDAKRLLLHVHLQLDVTLELVAV